MIPALLALCIGAARAGDGDELELDDALDDLGAPTEPSLDRDDEEALPPPSETLDDLPVPLPVEEGPADVPHRLVGLSLLAGGVTAQTPLSGSVAAALGLRVRPGLRVDGEVASWLGAAHYPGTRLVVPIAVPRVGLGVAWEAPTKTAVRPWLGVAASLAVATARPLALAPIGEARLGADIGRSFLAWRVEAAAGVMVCPALPVLAGPTYRAVAPVVALQTGPAVRL
ncbi:MAG: hypothetical protein R3F59_08610 [Myxococcota bacterium]